MSNRVEDVEAPYLSPIERARLKIEQQNRQAREESAHRQILPDVRNFCRAQSGE